MSAYTRIVCQATVLLRRSTNLNLNNKEGVRSLQLPESRIVILVILFKYIPRNFAIINL
jgi:hypothetical protein